MTMNKFVHKALKISAKLSEKLAIKSCGATSFCDAYQPKIPEAVRKLAKNNEK